jgi:signal transduction histidine kinase
MMTKQKARIVIPFAAFGAVAAFFGYEWSVFGNGFSALPLIFALGMAAIGGAALSGTGRRTGNEPARDKGDAGAPQREAGATAAMVSHEMKNYLCALKGNARLLRDRINDGNDKAIMDRIDHAVEKLESFTKNMNAPSSATSNRQAWRMRLGDEAKSCVAMHFLKDAERFKWEFAESTDFLGDPDRMEQVFLNLYTNALEAGASQITTSVFRRLDRLEVRIEDDGPGCAPADLKRIFEPFFTTKSGPARRGLGMFIVQSIVENHGGRIRARSKNSEKGDAHGLVFTLDFPLTVPAIPGKRGPEVPNPSTLRREERWLLALPEPI